MVNIVKSIVFYLIQFAKMPIVTAKAQQHLDNLSEPQRTSIRTQIGNRAAMYPFITENGFIYFLQNGHLVCVSLQEENGVYRFWFNGRFIEFDSMSGNCFIVDFDKNCLEYFCIDGFFQNATMNARESFLYRLLLKERLNRVDRKTIRSLRIFFTMREVDGQIERAGQSSLIPPPDRLSIHGMVRGIKIFIADRLSSCFMSPLRPNIFRNALLANNVPAQRPPVDERYGIGLSFNSTFRRPSLALGMMSEIMRRFVGKQKMTRVFLKRIANGFLRKMSDSLSSNVGMKFIENPIGFRQASGPMDQLLESCVKRTNLKSSGFPRNVSHCVSDMFAMDQCHTQLLNERRDEWFKEQHRLEQEKLQAELQNKRSREEFQEGIASIKEEVSQAQKRRCVLDEFADGGIESSIDETRKREREFEDVDSFLKFKKFE